jgi:TonB family protein
VDIVVLRSGIPATIPGRALDVCEGGISAILAADLRPGEPVGVDFRLSLATEPIRAKAIVRYSWLMRYGLQFLAMAPDQEIALRTWMTMSGVQDNRAGSPSPRQSRSQAPPAVERTRGDRSLGWWRLGLIAGAVILSTLLGASAWWGWNNAWSEAAEASDGGRARLPVSNTVVDVPSSVMEQRLTHRTFPLYPPAALQDKTEGVVVLDAIVGPDGTVQHVTVVSGSNPLSDAAQDAVKWWRFEPYQVIGQAVKVHTMLEVTFKLTP